MDVNELLDFLRLDKRKIALEKVNVVYDNEGLRYVELFYYEHKTRAMNKCVIGINGAKINEFATR